MNVDFSKNSGIYCFYNFINRKRYIGQAKSIRVRLKEHLFDLRRNQDLSNVLQNAWNKYEEENFHISIIEECAIEDLDEREIFWIKELHSHVSEWGYNIAYGGASGNRGIKRSDETKAKISASKKGEKRTKEFCDEISKRMKGWNPTEETRYKMSQSHMGIKYAKESWEKRLAAYPPKRGEENPNYGRRNTEKTKNQMSKSARGHTRNKKDGISSQYIGVGFCKSLSKWRARICLNGKSIALGNFNNEIDAALAYNAKSFELFGEEAILNEIEGVIFDKENYEQYFVVKQEKMYSQYKGVTFNKRSGKWTAVIYNNGKIHLGTFDSATDAAIAYNKKSIELFGENAFLNIILEETEE
jgi:group I intron endonuclease